MIEPPPAVERAIERIIFASRWLQVPLYFGLVIVLAVVVVKFFQEFVHLSGMIIGADESKLILAVLSLVDLVLVANLVVMVTISGYENFVSRLDVDNARGQLSWLGKLDAGTIKIKIASSIVAISAIHLLRAFLDAAEIPNDKLILLVVVHLTFVVSALLLAIIDRLASSGHVGLAKDH